MLLECHLFDVLAGRSAAVLVGVVALIVDVARGVEVRGGEREGAGGALPAEELVDGLVRAGAAGRLDALERVRVGGAKVHRLAGGTVHTWLALPVPNVRELPVGETGQGLRGDHTERPNEGELAERGLVVLGKGELERHVVDHTPAVELLSKTHPVVHPLQGISAAALARAAHDLLEVDLCGRRVPRLPVVERDARSERERDLVLGGGGRRNVRIVVRGPALGQRGGHEVVIIAGDAVQALVVLAIPSGEPLVHEVARHKLVGTVVVRVQP
mmetsp:Transcript_11537/g.28816  ORF Transcript_11537/g.28816 Transcript_11537/m.28816 type:complete len:271 (+) Transcript_11537:1506-2318(+)